MLGYICDEFEEKFKDNIVLANYVEDNEQIKEKSNEAVAAGRRLYKPLPLGKKDGSMIWVEFRTCKTDEQVRL